MDKVLRAKFAAAYVVLGGFIFLWTFAAIIAWGDHGSKASKSSVTHLKKQVTATQADAVKTACAYVAQQASTQGVIVKTCKLDTSKGSYQVKGDVGAVLIAATSDQYDFKVSVKLSKGAWVPSDFTIKKVAAHKAAP